MQKEFDIPGRSQENQGSKLEGVAAACNYYHAASSCSHCCLAALICAFAAPAAGRRLLFCCYWPQVPLYLAAAVLWIAAGFF
ncbi:hypothetical protein Acr_20g0001940 [Actinidia rufa]|uniref:Uncharacterized protein n=1 Tax=Actinidia rufa TaxID=165716 RepID=A0A7J0GC46_9ERIC|nr:hypothetical protein Acr_20g0001940 [Actinidia rufa]